MKTERKVLRFLYEAACGQKAAIMLLTLLQGALGASSVLYAMLLRDALDGAVNRQADRFWWAFGLLIGLFVLQNFGWSLVRLVNEACRSTIENNLKTRLFSMLMQRSYAQVTAVHSGEWMNRLTSDVQVTAGGLVDLIPDLTETVIQLAAALGMILYLEYRFIFILLPGGALVAGLTLILRRRLKQCHKDIQEANGAVTAYLQERLGSLMVLKAFSAEEQTIEGAREKMLAHKAARMRRSRFYNVCQFGFSSAMNGMYLLGFAYGGYGILTGRVTYGTLTALLQLIGNVQSPFASLSGFLPQYYAMTASAERLQEAGNLVDETHSQDAPEEMNEMTAFYRDRFAALTCQNLTFAYPDDPEVDVLQEMSLEIRKGDYIAFTGESGCGKSTLLKLLLSLYPFEEGKLQIHERSGQTHELTADWRLLFAYVPQGSHLMTGTIRQAVTFGAPPTDDETERVQRALRIACAEDFVSELEYGIETMLGERGAGLSEGQLQRLAIARAVYRSGPILLLDEATSALDEETESRVLANLKEMTDKTVLIVTHRRAALDICNRVLHFAGDGKCEEIGL